MVKSGSQPIPGRASLTNSTASPPMYLALPLVCSLSPIKMMQTIVKMVNRTVVIKETTMPTPGIAAKAMSKMSFKKAIGIRMNKKGQSLVGSICRNMLKAKVAAFFTAEAGFFAALAKALIWDGGEPNLVAPDVATFGLLPLGLPTFWI